MLQASYEHNVTKIAFVAHYSGLYGANRSLLNLIEGLKNFGIESYVILPEEGDMTIELLRHKINFAVIPIQLWVSCDKEECLLPKTIDRFLRRKYNAFNHLLKNILLLPRLLGCLKNWSIDLIYTNSGLTPIGGLAARILRIPHIWHLREFGDLDYKYSYDYGKVVFRFFVRRANAQIAVSNAVKNYFFEDSPPRNIHVVYNGVAKMSQFDKLYKQVQKNERLNNEFVFAIVGRVMDSKGQTDAIKAIAELVKHYSPVRLLIVGDGETESLKALSERLNVKDKVEYWGYVENPFLAYIKADALLMCSKNEAMGRVTVEAMSACCPVIGYDNAGTSELIEHKKTGLLYKGDYRELSKCMFQLASNQEWSKTLGKNAFIFARKHFCVELYAQMLNKIISDVLIV